MAWGAGAALLWGLLIIGTGILYAVGAGYTVPRGQYSAQGYEGVFAVFGSVLLAVAALPVGLGLWLLSTYLVRRRKGAEEALSLTDSGLVPEPIDGRHQDPPDLSVGRE